MTDHSHDTIVLDGGNRQQYDLPVTANARGTKISLAELSAFTEFSETLENSSIMIVDDEPLNVRVVQRYLESVGFLNFHSTSNALEAMSLIEEHRPDIVLLDIMMPGISGLDILQKVRQHKWLKHTPVIILTAASDSPTKIEALKRGANDFLPKPVEYTELALRVRNGLIAKGHHDRMVDYSNYLEKQVRKRTFELKASQHEIINCLARAAEYRDGDTGHHVIRVGLYAGLIARRLGFDDHSSELVEESAKLHDVGKIGIPDAVLLKPGRLEVTEIQLMQRHCVFGRNIIQQLPETDWAVAAGASVTTTTRQAISTINSPLLRMAAVIAHSHHEKWDGSGYPQGLQGDQIPLEGRITAVADVYDALSNARPYKEAFPLEKCFAMMEDGRGKHFDPQVLDTFLNAKADALEIQVAHSDDQGE